MSALKKETSKQVVVRNRRARFEYSIEESYEAGIELIGSEVKSLREGTANLSDGYAMAEKDQLFLHNVNIGAYKPAAMFGHEPLRKRRLLLRRQELDKLLHRVKERGYALVPLQIYFRNGWAKIELGLAKGKAGIDKREDIKERETRRELARAVSQKAKQYRDSRKRR